MKAVPKALVTTSERNIKKINGEQPRDTKKSQEKVVNYTEPLFQGEEKPEKAGDTRDGEDVPVERKPELDHVDFEKKNRKRPGIPGTTYPWRENRNSIMWISKRNWRNP